MGEKKEVVDTRDAKQKFPQPKGEKKPEAPEDPSSKPLPKKAPQEQEQKLIEAYDFVSNKIPVNVRIHMIAEEFVPVYEVSLSKISKTTEIILEKIRRELIKEVTLGMVDLTSTKETGVIENKFSDTIKELVEKYFPDMEVETKEFLSSYLIQKSLGLGSIEILMSDANLEEIAINQSEEPVWVYHRKHGWLKTNIYLKDENQTKHYATMIARKIGRQITLLEPLLDAHLDEGDRVNATLSPISTRGNTITIRKFSRDPWTITRFIQARTISIPAASLIWLAIQYELSAIIAGGTASGKTSMLNVVSNFFPPNQRIISIEDTREIQLPKFLHWLPMSTRQPNPEGKGGISMLDLLVNSLRQRPDRIIVGEVRRKKEAEVLFEAIHTGHSVYATFHANNAEEAITRLTSPPIDVPKVLMPAISLIVTQFRNRRLGFRRTFQIAEILPNGETNVLMQFDTREDTLKRINPSRSLLNTLQMYTGFSPKEISAILKEKEMVLSYLVSNNIDTVDSVGRIMAEYYTNKDGLMKNYIIPNRKFG